MQGAAPTVIEHIKSFELNPGDVELIGGKLDQFPDNPDQESAEHSGQDNLFTPNFSPVPMEEK